MPCIMNAANEVAVEAFLHETISFQDIPMLIEKTMQSVTHILEPTIDEYIETHKEATIFAQSLM